MRDRLSQLHQGNLILILQDLEKKYGSNVHVAKVNRNGYLSTIFKDQIIYNKKENKIEI